MKFINKLKVFELFLNSKLLVKVLHFHSTNCRTDISFGSSGKLHNLEQAEMVLTVYALLSQYWIKLVLNNLPIEFK